jgi:hypothetical protein
MTEVVFVALGGAIGGAAAVGWLVQSASHWVVLARVSAICALTGAFVALVPHPSGAVVLFIGPGLLFTLATSASVILPLPRLQHFSDVLQFAKRMTVRLAVLTFYGVVFAIIGNMSMQALWHIVIVAVYG